MAPTESGELIELSLSQQVVAMAHAGRPYDPHGRYMVGSTHRESDIVDRLAAAGYAIVRTRPEETPEQRRARQIATYGPEVASA